MREENFFKNNQTILKIKTTLGLIFRKKIAILFSVVLISFLFFLYLISPPKDFPKNIIINIEDGVGVKQVANILKDRGIIRSSSLFTLIVQFSPEKIIQSGDYLFEEKDNLVNITRRLINGDYGADLISAVITEGMTVRDIARRLSEYNFVRFDPEIFVELAQDFEGYLFPDTYIFSQIATETTMIEVMRRNFNKKIEPLQNDIVNSGKTLQDIIIMASIIEGEATVDTFQEISDILWHRMDINMPLQVDATFVYSIGKNSFTVTIDEMRDADNPYNTYQHTGLPPTPISNPGINSIIASMNNNPTEFLFFLTGQDGEMYYAVNHEGHVRNRRLYLD